MSANHCPKLRPIDARPIVQRGQRALLLRDPLRLSDRSVILPQQMAPLLVLCDGTRDVNALRASLAVRYGLPLGERVVGQILDALDGALLLENQRYLDARAEALRAYRQAPYRPPALAGESYPAEADALEALLEGYLAQEGEALPQMKGRGLVCPHIDYARGGSVYARVCAHAATMLREAELLIVLGTDHYGGQGNITLTRQNYATPYGLLPTPQDLVDALVDALGEKALFAEELHHRGEHSVELAAVWLHHMRRRQPCELLPVLCGPFGPDAPSAFAQTFVETLRKAIGQRRTVIIAAADLAHMGPAIGGRPHNLVEWAQLEVDDAALIAHLCAGDARAFLEALQSTGNARNVCGLSPIYLAMRLLEPVSGQRVAYARCPADETRTSFVTICGVVWR